MEMQRGVREVAARVMHGAIRKAIEDRGPAADRAWLAVAYIQQALASEGLDVVRRGERSGMEAG
ncbi:MAG: hypothetical protein PVJ73_13870 [Acidobacteriota bacterium]|jgi:hypothetical protein